MDNKQTVPLDVTVLILTAPKKFRPIKCSQILLPTTTGTTAILRGHAPLMSALEIGLLRIKEKDGIWTPIFICTSGVSVVRKNTVKITIFTVEEEFDEDLDKLNKVVEEARLELKQAKTTKARLDAVLKLKRSMGRYEGSRLMKIKKAKLEELKLKNLGTQN